MTAANLDIVIEQSATFEIDIYWTTETEPPVAMTLTNYTAKMEIRNQIGGTLFYTLTTQTGSPPATWTSSLGNGAIAVSLGTNHIAITIPASITDGFTWTSGVYDLVLTSLVGFSTRLIQGSVTVNPAVTRQ